MGDKRMSIDLEERRHIQVEMEGRVERTSQEQRLLERELNRIRQGGYRRPVQTDTLESRKASSPGRNSQPLNVSVVTSITPIRLTLDEISTPDQRNILELTPRHLESNRSRQDHFSHSPYLTTPDQSMHIDVRASPVFRHAFQQYMVAQPPRLPPLNEYDVQEAGRAHNQLKAEGSALDVIPEVMKYSPELQMHAISVSPRQQRDAYPSPSPVPRSEKNPLDTMKRKHNAKKSYDLAHLSSLDIHNIRANVSKRLSTLPGNIDDVSPLTPTRKISRSQSMRPSREKKHTSGLKDSGSQVIQDRRNLSVIGAKALGEIPKHRRSRKSEHRVKDFASPDIKQTVDRRKDVQHAMDMIDSKEKPRPDPYKYNPDGSLKTALNLPSFEKRYDEAKKARYIRHKDLKYREQELSVREIFNLQI